MRAFQGPPIDEAAPAKLNLALHVTARRGDGFHALDSLVVFTAFGDRLRLAPGEGVALAGPFGAGLAGHDNLCTAAAGLMRARVAITLDKRLPVASGLGGGSADAAAVLRGLMRAGWPAPEASALPGLGADVPVCLASRPMRMRGIGEVLDPVPALPDLALVLVNPGAALTTPAVFAALERADNPGLPVLPARLGRAALLGWLAATRNDLQAPAQRLLPVIGRVLAALATSGAELARMSGSGASCFGIFPDPARAEAAAARIRAAEPGWWVQATGLAPAGPRR